MQKENSLHLLNYNSPGATGALPVGAAITDYLLRSGIIKDSRLKKEREKKSLWDIQKISQEMKLSEMR
jgi:hypothetical protein